ncbi:iron complex outermembrane receptor protein [Alteromonas sp. 76-1]|jgi:iron complex outermembrane receptor protein|uniref:TonB-dependent receptor n=1 Tax=Alteromonas sp. 76-1 TaxID=2358187 RepID=UPI000FD16F7C|nr:TonB-dependent receptor [Alteromonas sp. 76-1]VEL98038.1 iron complex outermembrane receptor protein [Alteromonas sp. 76-1]
MRISNIALALALGGVTQQFAFAQQVFEEISVVAQKREQSVQDVGIAITALSGEQLDALGFDNAQQVTAMAPGVQTVQPNGEANYSVGIRGVTNSDFTTNVESPVALYVDEVYISQMSGAGFSLFDLERVEILRGPQGTLFGRNATGGLVHYITRKPTQELDAYAKITFGDYNQKKFEGAIGTGLTDNLSTRVSVNINKADGYITNRYTGNDLNNADDKTARIQFLYSPTSDFEALFNFRYAEQNIDTGFFENVSSVRSGELTPDEINPVLGYIDNDGDVYAGDYDDPGFNDLETNGATATLNWQINDELKLVSISDVSNVERTYIEDSDASPVPLFNFFLTTDAKQFSQELRLEGSAGDLLWVTGAYYLDLDIDDSNGAISDPLIGGGGTTAEGSEGGLFNPYTSTLTSTSVFAQLEYPFRDDLTLIGGLRFIQDEKEFDFSVSAVEFLNPESVAGFADSDNIALQAVLGEYAASRKDSEIAARLQLNWYPVEDMLTYFSWNRGVKGGGYNAPIFPLAPPNDYDDATLSYDPEQLDAFEAGLKTDVGEFGRLNAALYYYDYNDYQIFNIIGLDTITINSPDASSKGFELEYQGQIGDNWDVLLGAAFNDAEATLADGSTTTPVQSPKWNYNGLVRYSMPLADGYLALQADFVFRDDVKFALSDAETVQQEAYTIYNASITYTSGDDSWQVRAFVDNLADEEYVVQAFDLSGPDVFGITEQYYGKPRWWGVSFKYSWF